MIWLPAQSNFCTFPCSPATCPCTSSFEAAFQKGNGGRRSPQLFVLDLGFAILQAPPLPHPLLQPLLPVSHCIRQCFAGFQGFRLEVSWRIAAECLLQLANLLLCLREWCTSQAASTTSQSGHVVGCRRRCLTNVRS